MIASVHSSRDLGRWQEEARRGLQQSLAPYGLEYLARRGFRLRQGIAPAWLGTAPLRGARTLEARARITLTRTLLAARVTRRADLGLAILEPQAYAYALLATLGARPWSTTPLAALSCWLADDFRLAARPLKAWLRRCVEGIDLLVYWSSNQREILSEQLAIPEERLCFVHFGIEHDYFQPRSAVPTERYVLAAGVDRGRDYGTFLAAVAQLQYPVKLVCPRERLRGMRLPPHVQDLGLVEKARYRDLVRDAALVVVPVRPAVVYPTGQSVLLAAMSCRVPTVVTQTAALGDYTRHGQNTWTVPGEDPEALREGIERVLSDERLAERIAHAGRRDIELCFNTDAMWEKLAPRLRALAQSR